MKTYMVSTAKLRASVKAKNPQDAAIVACRGWMEQAEREARTVGCEEA